jgi:hypothetical protein
MGRSSVTSHLIAKQKRAQSLVMISRFLLTDYDMVATLVIARYNEKLDWLLQVPDKIGIIVYNKGEAINDPAILDRIERIENRRNFGRESETYLHHVAKHRTDVARAGYTIFCQGNPFTHSPDFLKLLECQDEWADIQPLTVQWIAEHGIPCAKLISTETEEHLRGCRVRSELFSLHHWNAVRFLDDGAVRIGRDYLSGHGLPQGTNIAAHFLTTAGWHELAEQAKAADFGQYAYGAIFAVRNELLQGIPEDPLQRLQLMARSHPLYPWIFERLWLHFFGLPFHAAIKRHSGNLGLPRKTFASSPPLEPSFV